MYRFHCHQSWQEVNSCVASQAKQSAEAAQSREFPKAERTFFAWFGDDTVNAQSDELAEVGDWQLMFIMMQVRRLVAGLVFF